MLLALYFSIKRKHSLGVESVFTKVVSMVTCRGIHHMDYGLELQLQFLCCGQRFSWGVDIRNHGLSAESK